MKKEFVKFYPYSIGRLATMIADYAFEKGVNYVELNEVQFDFLNCVCLVSGEVYNGEDGMVQSCDIQSVTFDWNDESRTKMEINDICKLEKTIQ